MTIVGRLLGSHMPSRFAMGLRLPVEPWAARGMAFSMLLGSICLEACFNPDESVAEGSTSLGTMTTTMTTDSTSSSTSPASSNGGSVSATSTSTSSAPSTVGGTETDESLDSSSGAISSDDATSPETSIDATTTGSDTTAGDTDGTSSTGETSDCPGGHPTHAEAPYVLRSIIAEQDVDDLDLGDIDGDGHLDLVSLSRIDGSVETFFGDGTGDLTTHGLTTLLSSGYPDTIRLGAIADDTVDLVVHMEGPVELWTVRGDGAGNWPNPQVYEGTYVRALDIADLNGDEVLDLAYVGATHLEVRLGIRLTESFGDSVPFGEDIGNVLRTADITGDGRLDLLTAGFGALELQIYSGLGDGSFQPEPTVVTSSEISGIDAGHLDDDDHVDLVLTTTDDLRVFYGRASGGIVSTPATVIENALGRVHVADIDADGVQDLITYSGTTIEIRFAQGDRTFTAAQSFDCPASIRNLKIGDLNEDCVPEILAAMGTEQDICALVSARE